MKISLNLATRPYADQGPALKRLRIGMAVLAVLLIGIGFGLMHLHQAALRMAAEESKVNRAIAGIRQERQGYEAEMRQPANARVLQQAGFLNTLFDEKSFSWTAAMEDMERVLPAGVQVTVIEPLRDKDGRLTLHLRVSGQRERAVEMVRNMERSPRFLAPRISGENTESNSPNSFQQVQDTGRVNFDILAEYNPATLEERKKAIAEQKRVQPQPRFASMPQPLPVVRPPIAQQPVQRPGYAFPNPQPARIMPQGNRQFNPRVNPQDPVLTQRIPPRPGGPANPFAQRFRPPTQMNVPPPQGEPEQPSQPSPPDQENQQ